MKFKIAVIGLLTAMLTVCIFTSYTLIDKANRQLELERLTCRAAIQEYALSNGVYYLVGGTETVENDLHEWITKFNEICGTD